MKQTYIVREENVEQLGTTEGSIDYEVEVDVNLADFDEYQIEEYISESPGVKDALLADLSIDEIVQAISHHKDGSGQWDFINKTLLLEAIND